jgi:replicative DNA helicase
MKQKKKKKSHWILKTIFSPFILLGWILKYTTKSIWWLLKKTVLGIKNRVQKNKIEKQKPQSKPTYKKFEEVKKIEGDFGEFENVLNSNGRIGIILGGRGNGKSALGMKILENIKAKTNKKVSAWGFNESLLPQWIKPINHIDEIENDSFVLIDESGISFSSRNSMSELNKLLTELILITRHKNISIIFITQNSSNIEINILRQADYILLKPHSLLQLNFERPIIKDIYSEMDGESKKFKDKSMTYVYSGDFKGFIKNGLPGFWSERTSKSFSGEKIEEKKK